MPAVAVYGVGAAPVSARCPGVVDASPSPPRSEQDSSSFIERKVLERERNLEGTEQYNIHTTVVCFDLTL